MPAAAAFSPIRLYSSAARLTTSIVVFPPGGRSPRVAVPIWVMPMSFAHAIIWSCRVRSSSITKCALGHFRPWSSITFLVCLPSARPLNSG